eukprot:TRINITY_DN68133_c0_g1_i1.p1 TRINITY_DN68133_c0_g1~~TRINITY_DN68133_c0_g1_i1.p1  ORF type:complete len:111 (+),score=20.59 TRINITY_DN68133_c0_g1_i1:40-372(+)
MAVMNMIRRLPMDIRVSGRTERLLQVRFFARDPEDGSRARKALPERLLEFRAEDDRLRDAWAWVGYQENSMARTLRHAKKLRRKLQYSSADPAGRAKREEQRRYWDQASR